MKQNIKRNITIAFAIIIYVCLMMCTILAVTPSSDFRMEQLARDDAGNVYVAGNAGSEVLVCRLDETGNMDRYYRCRREGQNAELLCECYGDRIYICQVWHGVMDEAADAEQHFSIWETDGSGLRCVLQGTIENDTRFTDIRIDEEGIFLAGMDLQTEEIVTYQLWDENLRILRYDTDFAPFKVCFGRNGLYILSNDSQMCFIGSEGERQITSMLGKAVDIITDKNGIYWQDAESEDIHYLPYDGVNEYVFRNIGFMRDIASSDHTPAFALILNESEENGLLVADWDETDWQYINVDATIRTPKIIVANALMPMLMVTLTYVTVWVVFVLINRFVRSKSKLLYRTMAAIIEISGISLVMLMVLIHFQGGVSYSGSTLVIAALIEWLVVIAVTLFLLGHIWRNEDIIIAWMDRISRGEYSIQSGKAPVDEFGRMWTALERMCRNLQMQKYRNEEITDYLYQYAPRNFERLFNKSDLHDVEIGETRQLPVTLGMISIIDKETLLTGKIQKQYMQYINRLMDLLFSQRDSKQAIFLQDGDNMENVKAVFMGEDESAPVAVRYSIECMEALLGRTEAQYDTAPFILLHTATVSCGLAGGSRQVYPYVTSLEMETLAGFVGRLRSSGLRLVVTENTWQQVQERVEGRYIGYVASPDQKYVFRLYEIMDACPQSQKLGRIKNRERFEQALELFYNNDLYLARSAFAEVLRECPDDGISEWYVFACDELFNEGNTDDKSYGLFGREEFC